MRHGLGIATAIVAFAAVVGCSPAANPVPNAELPNDKPAAVEVGDALVQFSLMASLAADDYTGGATLRELLAEGNFGLGTFDRLDGEMIVLDGHVYQALSDGTVREAELADTTPFAVVTYFAEDGRLENFSAATLDDLDAQLDRKLPRHNVPYALRIRGEFKSLTIRSVPAQSPPFKPLIDVVKNQAVWEHANVRGTMVGFRCPEWMNTINVSGYHWHFLSDDRKIGGHVFGCDFENATLGYDECDSVVIRLPNTEAFNTFDAADVSEHDVDSIERQRTKSAE
jgi:acetolactate decarboxylase